MGKTMGLCGNFNGNKLDDFDVDDLELDVNSKKDGQKFANEWIVEGTTCDLIDDIDDQIDCKDEELKNECEKFLIEAETLNQCRMYVDVNPYYEACLMDYCQVSQDPVTKCGIFEAYINECYSNVPTADQGSLCGWTAETECSDPCPLENEVWEACADPVNGLLYCPSTEPEIQFRSQRNDQDQMISPAPLCVCDNKNGFVLRNETCVKQEDCGCNADGRWVENGYETISRYCDFRCSCENNKFSCVDFKCEDNHECIPTDERSDFGFCRKITTKPDVTTQTPGTTLDPNITTDPDVSTTASTPDVTDSTPDVTATTRDVTNSTPDVTASTPDV